MQEHGHGACVCLQRPYVPRLGSLCRLPEAVEADGNQVIIIIIIVIISNDIRNVLNSLAFTVVFIDDDVEECFCRSP